MAGWGRQVSRHIPEASAPCAILLANYLEENVTMTASQPRLALILSLLALLLGGCSQPTLAYGDASVVPVADLSGPTPADSQPTAHPDSLDNALTRADSRSLCRFGWGGDAGRRAVLR